MAPPNSNSFSVMVVLPASGWEMIAKVRRLFASVMISVVIVLELVGISIAYYRVFSLKK
jgi:hypothetical protein